MCICVACGNGPSISILKAKRGISMLEQNIKTLRKAKGLSQQELAVSLHVVRQTVSKWETGLSVPDADMLIRLAQELDTDVNTLLGEPIQQAEAQELTAIANKLEVINQQLAQGQEKRRKTVLFLFLASFLVILLAFLFLSFYGSEYLNWNFSDPETAAAAAILHGMEWLFVRIAPIIAAGCLVGVVWMRKKTG
jgi:putative transcriptional regulator